MATNVSSLKGIRTRYRNTLDRELANARAIIDSDLSERDRERCLQDIKKCLKLIKCYSVKLEDHIAKLTDAVGDSDARLVENVIMEDCELILEAEKRSIELEQFLDSLEMANSKEVKETEIKKNSSEIESILEVQQQIQKTMVLQMKQQRDFFERQEKKEKDCSSVKLPKLDLVSFNGNKLEWATFWDSFDSTVHRSHKLSDIEKFNYLLSKLQGEAKRAVAGLALTNGNYKVAVDILKERFGNKQDVVNQHYKKLISIPPATDKVESLRTLLDDTEKHLRSLDVLGENINQSVFVSMINSKLPESVLRQLEINKGTDNEWTVDMLRTEIREYVSACEKAVKNGREYKFDKQSASNMNNKQSLARKKYKEPFTKPIDSAEALFVRTQEGTRKVYSDKCRYCKDKHWSDECPKYKTLEQRKQQLQDSCFKCLKRGHLSTACKTEKMCVHCGQHNTHHRSLCPKMFSTKFASVQYSESVNESAESVFPTKGHVLVSSNEMVLMQTAKTDVTHPTEPKSENVRILLDSGSQRTYVTERLAKQLGLKTEGEQELKLVTFGSEKSKVVKTRLTKIGITLKTGTKMTVTANVVPTISAALQRNPIKQLLCSELKHVINSVDLADTIPTEQEYSTVEVLIGNDYYLEIVLPQRIEMSPGLYLLSSKLGWILTGRTEETHKTKEETNMLILTYGSDTIDNSVFTSLDSVIPTKPDLTDFWNVEAIGIIDKNIRSEDELAMDNFKETVKFHDGRYYVTWPWKEEHPDLPLNRDLAQGRLKSCVKRMQKRPELLQKYNSVIQDQLQKGVIEKVNSFVSGNLRHYIPHHAVITPQKTTTKIRVVYDASSKTRSEQNSLNECLCRGPVMLHDLCGLLLRFRLHKIALVSDIEKAFLQIGLQESQRDVTRFLWIKSCDSSPSDPSNIQEYRFCRVPFGVISSPFLLGATVENHLELYDTIIANKLKNDIYVDNVITGTDSETEAVALYRSAKSIFKDASMNLREWLSNSDVVNQSFNDEDRADSNENVSGILGHLWNYKEDNMSTKPVKVCEFNDIVTKRNILKTVASVFDPLGLFSPVVLRGKLLLQKLWSRKLEWDENIEDIELKQEWTNIRAELLDVSEFPFNRFVGHSFNGAGVVYNLLCFCDASKDAYATTVYLQKETKDESKVDLIFAKTRLTPVKGMTIPRLELMAVLIGVRCVKFVNEQLKLTIQNIFLWTDSQCVLGWLNTSKSLPVFVRNRVSEIRQHDKIVFSYVNTKDNPADIASRGATVNELHTNNLWWHGPEFSLEPSTEWIIKSNSSNESQEDENSILSSEVSCNSLRDIDTEAVHATCEETEITVNKNYSTPFNIEYEKYSSLTKLIRVTAFILRFVKKLRKVSSENGSLKCDELQEAEHMWLRYTQHKHFSDVFGAINKQKSSNLQRQLGLFIDDNGLLRSKGRLENSSLTEGARFPILLPSKEHLTQLIVQKTHKQHLHCGISQTVAQIRQRFWLIHARAAVRSTVRSCSVCRKYEGGPYKMPPMASLPRARVTESRPFAYTGLDYMGPMYIHNTEDTTKVWVCLYTCLVTRAIHLELVLDMTTEQFLLGLCRFISQRGTPYEIISDNAQQFKAASTFIDRVWSKQVVHSEDVQNYISEKGIKYSFIVELAPWMGGFYERLVGLVKRSLRKSIGRKLLNLIQCQTLLKEVEAVINSRPLTYVGDDINSSITLTPNHFLTLNPQTGIPEIDNDETDPDYQPTESSCEKLLKLWKKGQKMLNAFWKIWKEDYLKSLRERKQYSLKNSRVQSSFVPNLGDIVLIKDNLPRGCWKMGKITDLIQSRDGNIRSAKVTTASGKTIGRPLKLLYPVECSGDSSQTTVHNSCPLATPTEKESRLVRQRQSALTAKKRIKKLFSNDQA